MFRQEQPISTALAPLTGMFLRVAHAIGVLVVVAFLITATVRIVATTPPLYQYGFSAYQISHVTNLTMDQLLDIAAQTRAYFVTDQEPMNVVIQSGGEPMVVYNEREVAHMADVKELFKRIRRIEELSGAYLLGLLGLGLWTRKASYFPAWLRVIQNGCLLSGGLVITAALAMLFSFDRIFLQFHLISFTNNLWMLDPSRDKLIMMYPSGFFRDASLAVGGLVLLASAFLAAVSTYMLEQIERLTRPPEAMVVTEEDLVAFPAATVEPRKPDSQTD